MNAIGGYFELELRKGEEYHKNAIRLNTGRNALELILREKQYKKLFIPYYTCDVILEPLKKLNIDYDFYFINTNFEPKFNFTTIKKKEGFLYINYFGIKDDYISKIANICKNLIIDNSQAFYALPIPKVPTFYSCRKFFGLPDGAYLYLDGVSELDYPQDLSFKRFNHLLKRLELGAESGYEDFKINENSLSNQPIQQMSKITKALLCNIDYEFVKKIRKKNYLMLQEQLSQLNELELKINKESVPMVFPFLSSIPNLKNLLIKNKIYVATYWPYVINWTNKESLEYKYSSRLICLPIDQRIDLNRIDSLIKKIKKHGG